MRFQLPEVMMLLLTLVLAAAVRVDYLVQYADNATTAGPLQVQDEPPDLFRTDGKRAFLSSPSERRASGLWRLLEEQRPTPQDELLENIKTYRWFGCHAPLAAQEERTAHMAPGYPWLVGELARLAPDSVRWTQAGLGALTAGLYLLFALRAFRSRVVAGLTGVLCALHPFWIVDTAAISDGVLATFLLAACIFLGARGGDAGGALTSLLFGLALAGLALVRAALLPFAVVALLWFLLRCRRLPNGWLAALLAFLGFITGLVPWTLRNFEAFHDVFPVANSMYYHLWMGNNRDATGGPLLQTDLVEALAHERHEASTATADWLTHLEQPERYRALARPVLEELKNNPQAALQRRLWAGLCFFFGEDWLTERKLCREIAYARVTPQDRYTELVGEAVVPDSGPYPLFLAASLLGMLLLGVLGWRLTYAWRHTSMPAALAVCWVPLPYILSHGEALSGPRLPLDGVFLCYAAFTLACVVPALRKALLQGPSSSEIDEPR
jgi:hypothetical protein